MYNLCLSQLPAYSDEYGISGVKSIKKTRKKHCFSMFPILKLISMFFLPKVGRGGIYCIKVMCMVVYTAELWYRTPYLGHSFGNLHVSGSITHLNTCFTSLLFDQNFKIWSFKHAKNDHEWDIYPLRVYQVTFWMIRIHSCRRVKVVQRMVSKG